MEDRYIDILVTEDMLEDPEEEGIPPLARAARAIEITNFRSGVPCYRRELRPGVQPKYRVNFCHSGEGSKKGKGEGTESD